MWVVSEGRGRAWTGTETNGQGKHRYSLGHFTVGSETNAQTISTSRHCKCTEVDTSWRFLERTLGSTDSCDKELPDFCASWSGAWQVRLRQSWRKKCFHSLQIASSTGRFEKELELGICRWPSGAVGVTLFWNKSVGGWLKGTSLLTWIPLQSRKCNSLGNAAIVVTRY